MAHDQDRVQPLQGRQRGGQGRSLQAQPVHAGIEMQGAGALGRTGPRFQMVRRGQHRRDARSDIGRHFRPRRAVQHENAGAQPQRLAHGECLFKVGNEKSGASGAQQGAGHGNRAESIGVGLDHGRRGCARVQTVQRLPVGDDARQMDCGARKLFHGQRFRMLRSRCHFLAACSFQACPFMFQTGVKNTIHRMMRVMPPAGTMAIFCGPKMSTSAPIRAAPNGAPAMKPSW